MRGLIGTRKEFDFKGILTEAILGDISEQFKDKDVEVIIRETPKKVPIVMFHGRKAFDLRGLTREEMLTFIMDNVKKDQR